ncbi:hypothetical protein SERLA73DRAFT_103070 [Serpula lacrymans var. lacrymans S7.3]|uniref:Histone-lysine N-methyltransferase SET5 n=2 Tax=Serpula lacrymans var. lacrymans TaxID=341189 RepID=F8PN23_SERL3|nr:uncharacterized protein SERLADRAFT_359922 [Serpula lacrymans var. lacrymans S7.9]EGO03005.1 hypothetical protein SERLA73DRAFT_103070 [Serpula lacrymans var. lacrymans S7.3]EGO28684.1 hypothetical protein SERLADRAFT_359922 [Serpula lacrymans var. lacrymans S7.9]
MSTSVAPPEDELKPVLLSLKADNPTLGVAKVHNLLLSTHPEWTVSEKRVRKILQNEGLILSTPEGKALSNRSGIVYPSSRIIEKLDVSKWSKKIEVKYFDHIKGKGLTAKEKIADGEVLWKEDHFVIAPEWEIYNLQTSSRACAFCTTPLSESKLIIACPASTSASFCPAMFCNRLCLARSAKTHPLLCPSRNPASVPLLSFVKKAQWMALHALAQCTSRLLLAAQQDEQLFSEDWQIVRGFAELGMEERFQSMRDQGLEPDRENWQRAYKLYLQAFKEPISVVDRKKLSRILKKSTTPELDKELFEYDAFLRGLGRMSLNLEAHGGLYTLHAHLNHSCTPSISVRHLDQHNALSRITIIARKDIDAGEELFISYVNPAARLKERRRNLAEWGFGQCQCERCLSEENMDKESGTSHDETDDLAKELKAGLGVL